MTSSRWKKEARPIIKKVLSEKKDEPLAVQSAALRGAYPFGDRSSYPYKVWVREIARARAEIRGGV